MTTHSPITRQIIEEAILAVYRSVALEPNALKVRSPEALAARLAPELRPPDGFTLATLCGLRIVYDAEMSPETVFITIEPDDEPDDAVPEPDTDTPPEPPTVPPLPYVTCEMAVAAVLSKTDETLHYKEIARLAGRPHGGTSVALNRMVKDGTVERVSPAMYRWKGEK